MRMLDIGTGAGFPGIPLKIYAPNIHVTAVDAVLKKIIFLRQLCRLLKLQNVECVACRMEVLTSCSPTLLEVEAYRENQISVPKNSFDIVISRAVGTIPYLLKLTKPFLAPDGHVLLQRGRKGKQEIADHISFLQEIGFQLHDMITIPFSFLEHPRYLTVFCRK